MTQAEIEDVRQVTFVAQNDIIIKDQQDRMIGRSVNMNNLVKPTIPSGSEYTDREVSAMVVEKMWRIVCLKELFTFYTQEQLQDLVNRACKHDYRILMKNWNLPTLNMTADLAVLGLYDIVIFADDYGSMGYPDKSTDGMTRFQLLKEVIKTIGFWATLMDFDGVVLRFFNSQVEGDGMQTSTDVEKLFTNVVPSGGTPMGEELENKILHKMVAPFLQSGNLNRPVLVITITDGVPSNESRVVQAITKCQNMCKSSKYGENAMAFSFAQIGADTVATAYLSKLDTDPAIGKLIDCTSEYNIEKTECGEGFTEAVWVVKLMIGAVDPEYDKADEGSVDTQRTQYQYNSGSSANYQYNQYAYPPNQYNQQQYNQNVYQPNQQYNQQYNQYNNQPPPYTAQPPIMNTNANTNASTR